MPSTRRSVDPPVRATRSQGTTNTPTHTRNKTPAKPVSNTPVEKTTKQTLVQAPRLTRSTPVSSPPVLHTPRARVTSGSIDNEQRTDTDKKTATVNTSKTQKTPSTVTGATHVEDDHTKVESPISLTTSLKKATKRSAGPEESKDVKKQKIVSTDTKVAMATEPGDNMLSPRRSSRSVVPNSRFKDMEMLEVGRKKTVHKDKGQTKPDDLRLDDVDYTSINVQLQSEAETVTEEIITEETQIDTEAQMNLFDELLVLQSNQKSSDKPTDVQSTVQENVIETQSDLIEPQDYNPPTTVVNEPKVSIKPTMLKVQKIADVIVSNVQSNVYSTSGDISSLIASSSSLIQQIMPSKRPAKSLLQGTTIVNSAKVKSPEKFPSPQVIVVPGSPQQEKVKNTNMNTFSRHTAMLSSKVTDMKNRVSFAETKHGKVVLFSPDDNSNRKIMVSSSTTEVIDTDIYKKEENVEQFKSILPENDNNDANNMSEITTGNVIHTPSTKPVSLLKTKQANVVTNDNKSVSFPSTVAEHETASVNKPLSLDATTSEIHSAKVRHIKPKPAILNKSPAHVVIRTLKQPEIGATKNDNATVAQTLGKGYQGVPQVITIDKGQLKKISLRANNQASEETIVIANQITVDTKSEQDNIVIYTTENEDLNTGLNQNQIIDQIDPSVATSLNEVSIETSNVLSIQDSNTLVEDQVQEASGDIQQQYSVDSKGELVIIENEGSGDHYQLSYENADQLQTLATQRETKKVEQKLMSSLCQVIEFEKPKETVPPHTAIEYVVFGDKMVPIHKPYQGKHGRIQGTKIRPVTRTHGRVETTPQQYSGPDIGMKIEGDFPSKPIAQPVIAQQGELTVDTSPGDITTVVMETRDITTVVTEPREVTTNTTSDIEALQGDSQSGQEEQLQSMDQSEMIESSHTEEGSEPLATDPGITRVYHGYIDQPSEGSEPTQIVEITPDMFAKEVYAENLVLNPATGEMVPESMVHMTTCSYTTGNQDNIVTMATKSYEKEELNTDNVVETTTQGVITTTPSAVIIESSPLTCTEADLVPDNVTATITEVTNASSQDGYHGNSSVETIHIESLDTSQFPDGQVLTMEGIGTVGQAVVLHIDEANFVATSNSSSDYHDTITTQTKPRAKLPQTMEISYPKINPAKALYRTYNKPVGRGIIRSGVVSVASTVSMTTSTTTQTEMETQTEVSDEEEEEGIPVSEMQPSTITGDTLLALGIPTVKHNVRKQVQPVDNEGEEVKQYVMVHLPEGAEIKNMTGRQTMKEIMEDYQGQEMVTMSSDGLYVCLDCDHKTDKKSNWYKHRRKHLGIRPHSCHKCPYKAATSSNLKRHMNIHDDVRNFTCTICGLLFRQKIHLERHVKYKHQEKKVKCPLCDYLCSSENPDLKIHIRRRHMPQEDGSMSAFTCDECGLMTVSKKDLKQHMKFHKKGPELKLFCEYCSFVTDCESRLRRHMLIHTKERPYQCGLCSYRGSQKEHVLRHMRSQHDVEVDRRPRRSLLDMKTVESKKKRHSLLDYCNPPDGDQTDTMEDSDSEESETGKPFEKSDYSSQDKIFACNHCSMKFAKLINLYKHLYAQHKHVMPDPGSCDFQCVVCEFRTNNKKNLLVHMRKHNMQDHTPPSHVYSCVLCRYINPRRRNLFQHMKKKHGIEIVLKDDGSNCYVTSDNSSVLLGNPDGEASVMALSEIITTQPVDDDTQFEIITDDGSGFHSEKISIDNIISVEDISSYSASNPEHVISQTPTTVIGGPQYQPTVAEHEAAEAIEGLQALAQQAGVLEMQSIDNEITETEIVDSEMMLEGEVIMEGETTLIDQVDQTEDPGLQLSSEQLNQLSSGDYVEINGEVYKVEIAQENVPKPE